MRSSAPANCRSVCLPWFSKKVENGTRDLQDELLNCPQTLYIWHLGGGMHSVIIYVLSQLVLDLLCVLYNA